MIMKKHVLQSVVFLTLLAGAMFLAGCVNEQNDPVGSLGEIDILTRIDNFNNSLTSTLADEAINPRDLNTTKACAVSSGDIVQTFMGMRIGASLPVFGSSATASSAMIYWGGLICGVPASYSCYAVLNDIAWAGNFLNGVRRDPLYVYEFGSRVTRQDVANARKEADVEIYIPEGFRFGDGIGVMHNAIIHKVMTIKSSGGQPGDQLSSIPSELEYFRSTTFINSNNKMLDFAWDSTKEYGFFNLSMMPESSKPTAYQVKIKTILAKFVEIYVTYPKYLVDVDMLVNEYMEMIEADNTILAADKEAFYGAFTVAAYAPRVWLIYNERD